MAPDPISISAPPPVHIPARRSIEFSAQGAQIAGEAYEKAADQTAEGADQVLWKGYSTLIGNCAVTDDEKAIARFGDKLAHVSLNVLEHNRIAFRITDCIAHPVAGPLGPALAQVFIKVADNVKLAESQAHVLWKGFDAITTHSSTTDDEKAVAGLGRSIAREPLVLTDHNLAALPLMQAIANSVSGPIGTTLAQLACTAAYDVKNIETANQVLWKGFNAIMENPGSTPEEKAVAGLGHSIAREPLELTDHNRAALPLMQAIANSVSGPIGTTLAQLAWTAADNVKNAESANQALWKGFRAIMENPGSTPEEKAIAGLADTIAHISLEEIEHNRIAFTCMKAIKKGVQGDLGPLLAHVALETADNVKYAKTANQVIWSAYKAIGKDPQLSEVNQAILRLGSTIAQHTLDLVDHNHLGFHIIEALGKPARGSVPHILAALSYKAAHNCRGHKAQSAALQEGFKAIMARPDATELEKDLAKIGGDMDALTSLSEEKADALRFRVMEHLVKVTDQVLPASEGPVKPLGELKSRVHSLEKKTGDSKSAAADLEQKNKADSAAFDSLYKVYEKLDKNKRAGYVKLLNGIKFAMTERTVEVRIQKVLAKIHTQEISALKHQIELIESAEALNGPTAETFTASLEEDDDRFIYIDGVKLERLKEQDQSGDKLNPDEEKGHS